MEIRIAGCKLFYYYYCPMADTSFQRKLTCHWKLATFAPFNCVVAHLADSKHIKKNMDTVALHFPEFNEFPGAIFHRAFHLFVSLSSTRQTLKLRPHNNISITI